MVVEEKEEGALFAIKHTQANFLEEESHTQSGMLNWTALVAGALTTIAPTLEAMATSFQAVLKRVLKGF